jgi:hypothetical protein
MLRVCVLTVFYTSFFVIDLSVSLLFFFVFRLCPRCVCARVCCVACVCVWAECVVAYVMCECEDECLFVVWECVCLSWAVCLWGVCVLLGPGLRA